MSEDELEIVSLTEKQLAKELPLARLRRPDSDSFDRSMRDVFAEQGWLGMTLDADSGGIGYSIIEEMLLFREMGRALGPVGGLVIALAARVAARAGNRDLARRLTGGTVQVALAVEEPRGSTSPENPRQRVRAIEVRDAALLLVSNSGGSSLFDISKASIEVCPCLDKSISMGFLDLTQPSALAECRGADIERAGQILTAAMLLGIAEAARDMVVEYAKQRHTFGRPIGAYQAVRHPAADMAVRCEVTRCQLFAAAVSLRDERADAGLQIDSAKLLANSAALQNVDWNIQLHGGIGVMEEYPAHFFMKRAQVMARCFGDDKLLLSRIIVAPIAA